MYTLCSALMTRKNVQASYAVRYNAIYAMKIVAESYGVVFSDAVIDRLYNELDEHLKQMQKP